MASRCNKYVAYYERERIDYTAVGWDRNDSGITKEHYDFFRYKVGVNVGGLRACINHFRWMIFVYNYMKRHPEATTIHACDLNSAFPASLYKKLHNKKLVVIFDACDWFSANFKDRRTIMRIFKMMEKYTCKIANEVIICEPERIKQIPFKLKKKELVLPNIPKIDNEVFDSNNKFIFNNNNITIAYFGGFAQSRFLTELLGVVAKGNVNLLIAGFGDVSIENKCHEMSKLDNIRYFGKLDTITGLQMSNHADIIYAMYCTYNANNVFAAPNKYYEAMMLGKPIISTKGTILESKITSQNIGYVIGESIAELEYLINNFDKTDLVKKGETAKKLWNDKYCRFVDHFLNNEYSLIIQ